ncbi:putative methyltransferase DDB_G0268948 [Mixophyes fleayi]|uniref:putative methyltransferase DDB_G0268948 n=1 Tax=Mixophyes fleayi TaxID=3061075 RepID=UPI003F4E2813
MDIEVFKLKEFSKVYQDQMCPVSQKVMNLILSYLEEKKGRPFELAVDAGCGTGRSTRHLAQYFCKVIGIDISESQINEARKFTPQENVMYQISSVEKMPVEDASVDLINADFAAHWFPVDKFMLEVSRVLKNRGCVALHSAYPIFGIQYKNYSETLTKIIHEALETLYTFEGKIIDIIKNEYQEMFDALPFADKQRITDIPVVFHFTLSELLGFVQSLCLYRKFLINDKDGAIAFMQTVEKK